MRLINAAQEVRLKAVTKYYGKQKKALSAVSMMVEPGSFTVLLGPSGSGKTTLLRSIAGIERISDGEIWIGGQAVAKGTSKHLPPERRGLAMVFQDYALWPHMKVWENVAFPLKRQKVAKEPTRASAFEMLERVGLAQHTEKYPNELSGGEQQRVALARALVASPGLVLFDEPLSNLDADLRERMRIEIATLTRESGATSIYITHDQAEAFALSDQVGVLERGRLVQFGEPEEIYNSPATEFVARFTGIAGEVSAVCTDQTGPSEIGVIVPHGFGPAIRARSSGKFIAGDPVRILLRPSAVLICDPFGDQAQLSAIVRDVAFRGRGYEVALSLQDGTQLNSVFSSHRMKRGESVGVRLDPEGCLTFSALGELATPSSMIDLPESSERELQP